jgi:hypothetical protein
MEVSMLGNWWCECQRMRFFDIDMERVWRACYLMVYGLVALIKADFRSTTSVLATITENKNHPTTWKKCRVRCV